VTEIEKPTDQAYVESDGNFAMLPVAAPVFGLIIAAGLDCAACFNGLCGIEAMTAYFA